MKSRKAPSVQRPRALNQGVGTATFSDALGRVLPASPAPGGSGSLGAKTRPSSLPPSSQASPVSALSSLTRMPVVDFKHHPHPTGRLDALSWRSFELSYIHERGIKMAEEQDAGPTSSDGRFHEPSAWGADLTGCLPECGRRPPTPRSARKRGRTKGEQEGLGGDLWPLKGALKGARLIPQGHQDVTSTRTEGELQRL